MVAVRAAASCLPNFFWTAASSEISQTATVPFAPPAANSHAASGQKPAVNTAPTCICSVASRLGWSLLTSHSLTCIPHASNCSSEAQQNLQLACRLVLQQQSDAVPALASLHSHACVWAPGRCWNAYHMLCPSIICQSQRWCTCVSVEQVARRPGTPGQKLTAQTAAPCAPSL